jgi:DNA polymerase-3 subunit delta'
MAWVDILGHEGTKRVLQAHLASDRIASAYLLVGPEGIGKRLLAHEMAKALNCAAPQPWDRPCDRCAACQHIAKQIHPDVHCLSPGGASEQIKIEAVRQVLGRIALRPFSGRYQVVIIDGAHRLTEEAGNSVLKSLEEPTAHTRFILTTSQLSRCLPTVVSRCQLLRCHRLSTDHVERILASQEPSCDGALRSVIARLANGCAQEALALSQRWNTQQQWVERFGQTAPTESRASGASRGIDWLEVPLPETRQEVEQFLDSLTAWLRDVAVTSAGQPARTAHQRHAQAIQGHAQRIDLDRCVETVLALIDLRESLAQFVSPRLVAALAREEWLKLST